MTSISNLREVYVDTYLGLLQPANSWDPYNPGCFYEEIDINVVLFPILSRYFPFWKWDYYTIWDFLSFLTLFIVSSKVSPQLNSSQKLCPSPFCFPPLNFKNLFPSSLWFPPLIYNIQISPIKIFNLYIAGLHKRTSNTVST